MRESAKTKYKFSKVTLKKGELKKKATSCVIVRNPSTNSQKLTKFSKINYTTSTLALYTNSQQIKTLTKFSKVHYTKITIELYKVQIITVQHI
jgi:hypothetical protein